MLDLVLFFLLGGLPTGYSNSPNYGTAKCSAIDEEVGRHLERTRDDYEKTKIYFDLMQWRCEDDGLFHARWYSKTLGELGEPSFAIGSSATGYADRFRLLAFSHSGAGYILRLDYRLDGSALLTFAEAEFVEKRKHHPRYRVERRLKVRWTRPLLDNEASAFLIQVRQADILRPQFQDEAPTVSPKADDDASDEVICISFASAVLERLDKEGRHTVAQTGCGQSEAIHPLIDAFHSLIGLEPLTLKPMNRPAAH